MGIIQDDFGKETLISAIERTQLASSAEKSDYSSKAYQKNLLIFQWCPGADSNRRPAP